MAFIRIIESRAKHFLPETAAFAEKQMSLLDGPPTFYDLDVVDERS